MVSGPTLAIYVLVNRWTWQGGVCLLPISRRKMKRGLQTRLLTKLMVVATIALVGAAAVNYHQRQVFELPDDGAVWIDGDAGVVASHIASGSSAAKSGIQPGDRLLSINQLRVGRSLDVPRILTGIGVWKRAAYGVSRDGVDFDASLIISAASTSQPLVYYFQLLVGVTYLAIGVFVFARRTMRPMVRHFYSFCLASFVLYCFSYTGSTTGFDRFIYWGDVWATLLVPAVFLHFCLIFPRSELASAPRKLLALGGYVPVTLMLVLHHLTAMGAVETDLSLVELRQLLDRVEYGLLGVYFVAGAILLNVWRGASENVILRQQRKWLATGTLWGVLPFAVFYLVPYVSGQVPGPNQSLSVLSLGLIPLTFAYAVVKFRLMDVDVIFRRGVAYSLATTTLLALFYGLALLLGGMAELPLRELTPATWVLSVIAAALLFQPLRGWIQTKLEERLYRERYDYRRTLVDFASELSSETDLDHAVTSFSDRLVETLALRRLAVFVAPDPERALGAGGFKLIWSHGLTDAHGAAIELGNGLDLSFLAPDLAAAVTPNSGSRPYLFYENPRWPDAGSGSARHAILDLDLNYYVPCRVRGKAIAYLGLGRTKAGDYLSSEDLSLVQTVSGYFAVALENSRLVQSLERKAAELERLKDYNENIVESLSVGILALDQDERVESWNSQLELTFGIPREVAVGRRLIELLPGRLVAELQKVRGESGIQNIYKFPLRASEFPAEFQPKLSSSEAGSNGSNSNVSGSNGYGSYGSGRPTDQGRILNVAIAPLVAKNFDHIGRLIIVDDVTERVELEEQLVEADKLGSVGLVAAGVAHEVNTPLAVISSYAQMLAKRITGDPQQTKILDKITSQTFRASEIVNSLLNVSRTSPREFSELDLGQVVEETLDLVQPPLKSARVTVETAFDPEVAKVVGNSGRLQQVFLNLFINARDAMPQGGRLRVETRGLDSGSDRAMAAVIVSDTGSGIDPQHLKKIFDPFFTTKTQNRGTGLGLAVSHGIVREHSGTMSVESTPGQGTTFRIELPLARKAVHA